MPRTTSHLSRMLSALTLRNASALLALGAVTVYVIGIFRTIGILHAEQIPLARGLPVAPLQDYFLRGLAVVADPSNLGLIACSAAIVVLALDLPVLMRSGQSAQTKAKLFSVRRWVIVGLVCLLAFYVLFVPVAEWAPIVVPLALAAGAYLWAVHSGLPRSPRRWSVLQRRLIGALLASCLLGMAGGLAYFAPPALDRVTLRTVTGAHWKARILEITNSHLYLAPPQSVRGDPAPITVLPLSRIVSLTITEGPRRPFRTIPEALHAPLVRLDLRD